MTDQTLSESVPTVALNGNSTVDDFVAHFASIIEADDRDRLLRQVRMRAAAAAPEEAFAEKVRGRTAAELLAEIPATPAWLIPGVAAKGWTVKIAAREKMGKGTLIAYLLGRLERGAATVFGAGTAPVTSLIYTEEPPDSIREKVERADLAEARIVYGWELADLGSWAAKAQWLIDTAEQQGHGVVFVDNVSRAAGVEDENGVELARAVELLSEAARAVGVTCLIDHHHKKGAGRLDDKSRGGTALAGACENNIEMERVGGWDSRVRRLSSRGRLSSTIWEMQVALSDDGRDYELVASDEQPQTARERSRLIVLSDAGDAGVTAAEFAAGIDASDDTARRALGEFVIKGWAAEVGAGYPTRWVSTGEGLRGPVDLLAKEASE